MKSSRVWRDRLIRLQAAKGSWIVLASHASYGTVQQLRKRQDDFPTLELDIRKNPTDGTYAIAARLT